MSAPSWFSEVALPEFPLLKEARDMENKCLDLSRLDRPIAMEFLRCPVEGGRWEGERGDSIWHPDPSEIPANPKTNPEGLTWGQIMEKYSIDGIPFKDGEPDFSEVAKATVRIDEFTSERDENFAQADEKLAAEWKCPPSEVRQWRKENHDTWHECKDCATMQLVPTEVHGNVVHEGGIAAVKARASET